MTGMIASLLCSLIFCVLVAQSSKGSYAYAVSLSVVLAAVVIPATHSGDLFTGIISTLISASTAGAVDSRRAWDSLLTILRHTRAS